MVELAAIEHARAAVEDRRRAQQNVSRGVDPLAVVVAQELAAGRRCGGVGVERGDEPLKPAARELDVVVEQRDELGLCLLQSAVERRRDADVLLPIGWYIPSMSHIGTHSRPSTGSDRVAERSVAATPTRGVGDDGVAERQVVVGDRGRVVLPAAVRAELGLEAGSRLLLNIESDGSLRLRPFRAVADSGRGILAGLGGGSAVDELIGERRAAAAAEDAE